MKLFPIFILVVVVTHNGSITRPSLAVQEVLCSFSACSPVTFMGHISSSTAFEHRFSLSPLSLTQWGAEMEVNFKP